MIHGHAHRLWSAPYHVNGPFELKIYALVQPDLRNQEVLYRVGKHSLVMGHSVEDNLWKVICISVVMSSFHSQVLMPVLELSNLVVWVEVLKLKDLAFLNWLIESLKLCPWEYCLVDQLLHNYDELKQFYFRIKHIYINTLYIYIYIHLLTITKKFFFVHFHFQLIKSLRFILYSITSLYT